jgi:hypothetical protein
MLSEKAQTIARLRGELEKLETREFSSEKKRIVSLGDSVLDEWFPSGGLPRGSLTELRGAQGSGALFVAMRALASESQKGWVALVDGYQMFYPLGMNQMGACWEKICVVRPPGGKRFEWAAQQLARSGLFSLIVLMGEYCADSRGGRTLLQAAEAGDAALVLAGSRERLDMYPCALRVKVSMIPTGERELLMLRGGKGSMGTKVRVSLGG